MTRSLSGFRAISRLDIVGSGDRGTTGQEQVRAGVNFALGQADTPPSRWLPYAAYFIPRAVFWASPCLAALTFSVLIMAFVPPRPSRYRLLRQPGIMAAAALVAALGVTAILAPQTLTGRPTPAPSSLMHWQDWWAITWFALPRTAGYAVALCWLTLFVSGRWAANRGWLDRLGRLLGSCWISLGFLSVLAPWLAIF
jgi:hypothetical protein